MDCRGKDVNDEQREQNTCQQLTIDGNSDDLRQDEAIGALEGRDLAQRVNLAVLSAVVGSRVRLSLDQLQVKAVVLGSDQDGDGATVFLLELVSKIPSCGMNFQAHTGRP